MTTPQLYRRTLDGFGQRLHGVADDQWDAPTSCCPDWVVKDLVGHVVEEQLWTAPLLEGRDAGVVADELQGDLLGEDPHVAWDEAASAAAQAVDRPGVMGQTVQLPGGTTTGGDYLSQLFADTLIHTWDLARAVGGDDRLDPELVDACARWFDTVEDEWRHRGDIGPPVDVSDDADPQTQLLARFGRRW